MSRAEFSIKTRREGVKRAQTKCEATGPLYGLAEGQRCNANLGSKGLKFDHLLACSNGGKATLDNMVVCCKHCHAFKPHNHDTPRAAKIKRQSEKHLGIRRPKRKIRSRGFDDYDPDANTRYVEHFEVQS